MHYKLLINFFPLGLNQGLILHDFPIYAQSLFKVIKEILKNCSEDVGYVPRQLEPSLGSEDVSRLWKIARREVGRKWDILKLCSSVLDENVGWETCKRERKFSEKRRWWTIRNMRFLNLTEGKKVVGKQLPPDSVWIFWENKTRGRVDSVKCSERLVKEREQMLKNLEDDKEKAKTVKKKKLQKECARMMTRLVVDWEMKQKRTFVQQ